jgi:hypothetical protein
MTARIPTRPALAVLAALFVVGCAERSDSGRITRPPNPQRMSPTELHTFTVVNGAKAAAQVGQQELGAAAKPTQPVVVFQGVSPPQPPTPPAVPEAGAAGGRTIIIMSAAEKVTASRPARSEPVIKLQIRSDKPHVSEEMATADALQVAQMELMKALQALDPPIAIKPSLAKIHSEYLRRDTKKAIPLSNEDREALKQSGLRDSANRVYMTFDVELTERQVQKLRAEERVNTAFQVGGVLLAILLAVHGFLRLDAWTKGYLTSWLAIGAIGLVLVAVLAVLA